MATKQKSTGSAVGFDTDRQRGVVKWWSSEKGFGFITPDGLTPGRGNDIFVHHSGITESRNGARKDLQEGERVEFEVEETDKGPSAINVMAIA